LSGEFNSGTDQSNIITATHETESNANDFLKKMVHHTTILSIHRK